VADADVVLDVDVTVSEAVKLVVVAEVMVDVVVVKQPGQMYCLSKLPCVPAPVASAKKRSLSSAS
jgi:hypothetical protein